MTASRAGLADIDRLRAFLAYVDGRAAEEPTYVGSCLQPEEVEALRRVLDLAEGAERQAAAARGRRWRWPTSRRVPPREQPHVVPPPPPDRD